MQEVELGLTWQDIRFVVEDYIGVSGGYLGDFSYKTHQEFYRLYCNVESINTEEFSGTTRERFSKILKKSEPQTQAKILKGALDKYPTYSAVLRTAECYDKVFRLIQRLEARSIEIEKAEDEIVVKLIDLLRGDWFLSTIGYFANHRQGLPYSRLDDEYKVQDLVYCLASTLVGDLQFENPQSKNVGSVTYTRVDFSSKKKRLFIETKLASSKHDAKQTEREISEDIMKYGRQPDFSTLVFFVYCYDYTFPNSREFERGFTGKKTIDGHEFQTFCIVKP